MTDELCFLTIAEAGRLIKTKALSSVELTKAMLSRIDDLDPQLNSYLLVTRDHALRQAQQAEREIISGHWRGPLHGIPYGLKDIIETAEIRTTAHSKVLAENVPCEDATVARRLKEAGAVLLGKHACYEFANSGPCYDLPWPPARNPWDPSMSPGGSSSGSGVAVAAGLAMGAIGSDTAGSIRGPASLCGIAGLKPTYGRVSRRGVIPHSYSFDHVGPMTWNVEDCSIMLGAIAGFDVEDPASAQEPVPDFTVGLARGIKGLRIGVLRHLYERDMSVDPETHSALDAAYSVLTGLGAVLEEIEVKPLAEYSDCRSVIVRAEDYAFHEKDFINQLNSFGVLMRNRAAGAAMIRAVDYVQAQRKRLQLARGIARIFRRYDALVTANFYPIVKLDPAVPGEPGRISITTITNVTGHPTLSIPTGFGKDGLPRSMQIIGAAFDEATVLRIGHAYEQATPWKARRPALVARPGNAVLSRATLDLQKGLDPSDMPRPTSKQASDLTDTERTSKQDLQIMANRTRLTLNQEQFEALHNSFDDFEGITRRVRSGIERDDEPAFTFRVPK
jgi:aspartyl-tRNA(Asn)/glutamyl-tRNA(Gln) amidotransferase subunit A